MPARAVARGAAGAIVALWAAGAPLSAGAETLRASYGISLIGVPIGIVDVTTAFTGNRYALEANARVSGVASLVTSWREASSGTGTIEGALVAPATFATTASTTRATRTIRMALAGNAVTGLDVSPPFDPKPDLVPVTERDKEGVIDPVAAALLPLPAGANATSPAACNRTLPIFDGATRFDIALSYVGERKVKAKGYNGPVAICAARYIPVAGYLRDRPTTKFWIENKDIEVWLAPVGSENLVMPFRVSMRTPVGVAVIEAREFHTGGE